VPDPVTTHYTAPCERVLLNKQRDANPFFHLFEALWMLTGAEDVAFPAYFVPRMRDFSDDGKRFHGAYGYRWRKHFNCDQLQDIVYLLKKNRDDRRVILGMWDPHTDLSADTKDIPCNISAKFDIFGDALNMAVFNRSNDIIMGCYGANVVHFSILQEYLASMIGVEVGWYEQISTNFHAYLGRGWDKVWPMDPAVYAEANPYDREEAESVIVFPLVGHKDKFDYECKTVVQEIREHRSINSSVTERFENQFFHIVCTPMSMAYALYRDGLVLDAISELDEAIENDLEGSKIDWLIAGRNWLARRVKT